MTGIEESYEAIEPKIAIQVIAILLRPSSYKDENPICRRLSHVKLADRRQYEALSYGRGHASQRKEVLFEDSAMQLLRVATISVTDVFPSLHSSGSPRIQFNS